MQLKIILAYCTKERVGREQGRLGQVQCLLIFELVILFVFFVDIRVLEFFFFKDVLACYTEGEVEGGVEGASSSSLPPYFKADLNVCFVLAA